MLRPFLGLGLMFLSSRSAGYRIDEHGGARSGRWAASHPAESVFVVRDGVRMDTDIR